MKSPSLGKLFGIEIELHWTFLLLIFFVLFSQALLQPSSLLPTFALFFFLFASVFFHELCHSGIALYKNCKVSKITLLPIGGVSIAEDFPENPKDEFLIAIAGPLFNFLIALLVILLVSIFSLPFPIISEFSLAKLEAQIFSYPLFALFYVNLMLGMFNLFLPAMPLDGGRVFRSLLSMRLGALNSTRIITKISMVVAILLFIFGFLSGSLIIILISAFVYIGAQQESQFVLLKEFLQGVDLNPIINQRPIVLDCEATLEQAIDEMLYFGKTTILIKTPTGYAFINADIILSALKEKLSSAKVSQIWKEIQPLSINAPASKIVEKIFAKGLPIIPLINEKNELAGTIEANDLEIFLQLMKLKKIKV